jgi:hypothetical protein
MKKNSGAIYIGLLGLSLLFAVAALVTLIPRAGASWPNIIGYKSVCTFAPMATAVCGLFAGITCVIRARLFGPRAGQKRSWLVPIIVGIVLAAIFVAPFPSYLKVKADSVTAASEKTE